MGEIINLTERAIGEIEFADILVVGQLKDGALYFASSTADKATIVYLLEAMKLETLGQP